jgi:translation elongation factor EF-Tu-like GTPase
VPRELFAVESTHLKPLPAWIPEVYRLHARTVDVEGYVSVNSIRYSAPVAWIGRRVEVRETRDKIEIELDARHLVTHERGDSAESTDHVGRPSAAARGRCQAQRSAPGRANVLVEAAFRRSPPI